MSVKKVWCCALLTLTIVMVIFAAPPRNVVEMNENADKEIIKQAEKLSEDDLKPPDHIDGLKLEQDGHINKDYKKEIFLGEHEEIEDDSLDVAESKLKDIFHK